MSQALPQVFLVRKETEHTLRFDFDLFFIIIVVMIFFIWFTVILAGRGPHTVWMEESWVRLDDGRRLPQDCTDLRSHQSHQGQQGHHDRRYRHKCQGCLYHKVG